MFLPTRQHPSCSPFRPTLFPKQPSEDGDKGNVGLPHYIVRLSPLLHVLATGCTQQYSVELSKPSVPALPQQITIQYGL